MTWDWTGERTGGVQEGRGWRALKKINKGHWLVANHCMNYDVHGK